MVLTSEITSGSHDVSKYRSKIKLVFKELTKLIDRVEDGEMESLGMLRGRVSLESRPTLLKSEILPNF